MLTMSALATAFLYGNRDAYGMLDGTSNRQSSALRARRQSRKKKQNTFAVCLQGGLDAFLHCTRTQGSAAKE